MEQQSIFFRALISNEHERRWTLGKHNSFHHKVPGDWVRIWTQGSLNIDDYPLHCQDGIFTEAARAAFIRLAPAHRPHDRWPDDQLREVGELAGVCAFSVARDAYEYGANSVLRNYALVVEFIGEYLCAASENNGVVAKVIKPLGNPMKLKDFKAKHNL